MRVATSSLLATMVLGAGTARAEGPTPVTEAADDPGALELVVATGPSGIYGSLGGGLPSLDDLGPVVDLSVGHRLSPRWALGAYGTLSMHAAFASSGPAYAASVGLQATHHFAPDARLGPWAGVGAGIRRYSHVRDDLRYTYLGFDVLRVQLGLEPRASGRLAVSPVVGATLSSYLWRSDVVQPGWVPIADPGMSVQVFAGISGRFDLLSSHPLAQAQRAEAEGSE